MVRTLIVAILMFLTGSVVSAQPAIPTNITSLYNRLAKSNADTSRVNLLIAICRYDNANSAGQHALLDSALIAANRAASLAVKLNYPEGIGLAEQVMAQAWCYKKNFKKSDELIKKAVEIFLKNGLLRDAAEAYLNVEEFYLSAGGMDFQVMADAYEKALPLFERAGAVSRAAATLDVLGDFYMQIGDYKRSIADLNKALSLYKSIGYQYLQNIYCVLGDDYRYLDNLNEGLKCQLLAVKTAEFLRDTTMELCRIYNHTGIIYYTTKQFKQASYYFGKAISVAEKYRDPVAIDLNSNLVRCLNELNMPARAIAILKKSEKEFPQLTPRQRVYFDVNYLNAYVKLKDYSKGRFYCEFLLKTYDSTYNTLSEKGIAVRAILIYFIGIGNYKAAETLIPIYKKKLDVLPFTKRSIYTSFFYSYQIDSARGNYLSAMQNYRKYATLRDSVTTATLNKQMQELQVQYETEKKEKENSFLRKEGILQINKAKQADRVRDISLVGTVLLLILIGLLYYSYRINQKNSNAINKKNSVLNQLIIEKEWLIKEIHHRVKNNLQIVMGLLQRQSAYIDNDAALAAIQNSENRMQAVALIHQKLYQSESLDLILMSEYIDEMISYLNDSCDLNNRIFFEKHVDDISLDVAQAVPLGLIINEAITNAVKYAYPANATGTIYISMIKEHDGRVDLTIADNGPGLPVGFDVDKISSLGLNLIKGLCKQLAGDFEIGNEDGCLIHINFKIGIFDKDLQS